MTNETCTGCNTARATQYGPLCRRCEDEQPGAKAVEITRTMIPAWQNALVGRWDYAENGTGPMSLSRGAAHVDALVQHAAMILAANPLQDRVMVHQSHLAVDLGSEEDAQDCWRALVTLRGEAGQLQRLAERAGL